MAAVPSASRAAGVELPAAGIDAEAALLYERHYARVLRFCRSRLATPEDAEDAAQTTFTYALGGLRRGVVPRVEAAWLLKIARNVCLDRWDAARRRGRVELVRDPHVLEEIAPAPAAGEDDLIGIGAALLRLTEQQRRAILLREWQGLSYREVGEELGLSQQAVESLLFRARRALARDLRGERQVRSGFDLGSLVAAVKSLFTGTGAAIKLAAVAATLATAGAVAGPPLAHKLVPVEHSRPVAPVPAPATTASPAPRAGTRRAVHGRAARPEAPRSSAGPVSAGPKASGVPAPRGAETASASAPVPPTPGAAPDARAPGPPAPTADAPAAGPSPPAAPPPTPPPAPSVSVPPVPTVPPVEPPALPSPSLPAVPDVLPVDPPALPPTPTVSTPELPVNLP